MTDGFFASPGTGYLFAVLGFLVCFAATRVFWSVGKEDAARASNAGSRMMYLVWQAAILLALSVSVWLTYAIAIDALDRPSLAGWIAVPLCFLAGGALGLASVLRTSDAGLPSFAAVCGIIPLANIWLMAAKPDPGPERQPYVPARNTPRILVSLVAIAVIMSVALLNGVVTHHFTAKIIAQNASRGVVARRAALPEALAQTSTLRSIDVDPSEKSLYYVYDVTGQTADRAQIETWLGETMKPDALKTLCKNVLVKDRGWFIGFQYLDTADTVIASTNLTNRDCRGQSG